MAAVFVHGSAGSGKTMFSGELARLFGKYIIVDEVDERQSKRPSYFPDDSLVLSQIALSDDSIPIERALQALFSIWPQLRIKKGERFIPSEHPAVNNLMVVGDGTTNGTMLIGPYGMPIDLGQSGITGITWTHPAGTRPAVTVTFCNVEMSVKARRPAMARTPEKSDG